MRTIQFRSMNRTSVVNARFVYYGETDGGRLLAVIVTERGGAIRVVTAYDLDAGQRRDYLQRRVKGE